MAISNLIKNREPSVVIAGIPALSIVVLVPMALATTPGSGIPTLIKDGG